MHTLPDIAGADATVGLGNPAGARASWVKFLVSNNGPVRIGDQNTGVNQTLYASCELCVEHI